jgi:hypothetical protein
VSTPYYGIAERFGGLQDSVPTPTVQFDKVIIYPEVMSYSIANASSHQNFIELE